jgi:hypothetical protein
MADNTKKPTGQGQADSGKPQKQPEKPVGNPNNRDLGADPNKNKMAPGTQHGGQGGQINQGNQKMANPGKLPPDKDPMSQGSNDPDDDDRATQRTQRPNLDRDDQK